MAWGTGKLLLFASVNSIIRAAKNKARSDPCLILSTVNPSYEAVIALEDQRSRFWIADIARISIV